MADNTKTATDLPPFDPKSNCIKCGWSIPDPVAPTKLVSGADGKQTQVEAGPPPPPQPPNVTYCNGLECPWNEQDQVVDGEHLHQFCDTCGFEWVAQPLAYGNP